MWIDDLRARVEAEPDRIATVHQGRRYTYREFWERSAAAGLTACREQPGPRHWVALADPQAFLEAIIGAWIHGKVPVAVPADLSIAIPRRLLDGLSRGSLTQNPQASQEALILSTSGSTGIPKLVALSHRQLAWRILTTARWYGLRAQTQALVATAIYTHASLVSTSLLGLLQGWTLHLFPISTPGSVLHKHIRSESIGVVNAPASFFRLLLRYGANAVFPSMRHIAISGEAAPRSLLEQVQAAFPAAQPSIVYGTTEAGRVSVLSTADLRAGAGGCGVPLTDVETRIAPVAGMEEGAGELLVRSPALFLGYLQEDGSYEGLDAEGFLSTGDLMRPDADGCLFHLGRIGGLVKVGGLMVHPREVEQALQTLPGVADALCWAEPHSLLGNAIAAMVVPRPGVHLDERALRRECASRMEKHKVPRTVTFVEKLPETPAGKRSLKPTLAG